jgi:hypothetical protein
LTNQKKELSVAAMFVNRMGQNSFSSETAWPNDMKLGKKQFMEGPL